MADGKENILEKLKRLKSGTAPPAAEAMPSMTGAAPQPSSRIEKPIIFHGAPARIELILNAGQPQFSLDKNFSGSPVALQKLQAAKVPGQMMAEMPAAWKPLNLKNLDMTYFVQEPHASIHIHWDAAESDVVYDIVEPILTPDERLKMEKVKDILMGALEAEFFTTSTKDTSDFILREVDRITEEYAIDINKKSLSKIKYYVLRDFMGLGKIEPIIQDIEIEDINCDGLGIPVYIYHRKFGSLRTKVVYTNPDELNSFAIKLSQRCGGHISVAEPLFAGALPDGSRVQVTYGKDIAMRGSTFTIRKFTKDPLTPVHLMEFGSIPPLVFSYLWLAVEHGNSLLVSGGTATGKTTALNALSLFIPPVAKIISIEDTAELNLPHEHWIPKVTRLGFGDPGTTGQRRGEVDMFELLKAALRERPDYIIVGEVRGKEAYILFQGMATGHPGMATIHAESIEALLHRLETQPISLSPSLLEVLDIVLFLSFAKIGGREFRRMKELVEISKFDPVTDQVQTNSLFQWDSALDNYRFSSDASLVLEKIAEGKGITPDVLWGEIDRRRAVLEWMKDMGIYNYRDVGRIIARYYRNPETVLTMMNEVSQLNVDEKQVKLKGWITETEDERKLRLMIAKQKEQSAENLEKVLSAGVVEGG